MKIGGVEIKGPSEEILVLPRLEDDIVIRCRAVLDMSHFHALCPEPVAQIHLVAGGKRVQQTEDPGYLALCAEHAQKRFSFIALKSLEPSEIEWSTVNMDNPSTWANWEKELLSAGLSSIELNRIVACIMQANCLDESKLEKARETFLRGLEEPKEKSSGQDTEPQNTQSGEPAKDSE